MKCAAIIVVGSDRRAAYEACQATLQRAWAYGPGPFSDLHMLPVDDFDGDRTGADILVEGVSKATELGCEWIFRLDAGDLVAETAFTEFNKYCSDHDAVWGMIVSRVQGSETAALVQPQSDPTNCPDKGPITDASRRLRTGYFLRTACATSIAADPASQSGTGDEDQFLRRLRERFGGIKAPEVFAIISPAALPQPGADDGGLTQWDVPGPSHVSRRSFEALGWSPDTDSVILEDHRFYVHRHWFWPEFADGWEEETWRFYRRFADPARPILDLGCWIGPTALFAARLGVRKVVAVDGNPRTAEHLSRTRALNMEYMGGLAIVNAVIGDRTGVASFGNLDGSEATSSASSTRGKGFTVPAHTIEDIMQAHAVEEPCIIKMDLEGSEREVLRQLLPFRAAKHLAINVSLHPPFWPKDSLAATVDDVLDVASGFELWATDGQRLDAGRLREMMLYSGDAPPPWGTKFGNYFEIVLKPR